jgi:hypothetical protein
MRNALARKPVCATMELECRDADLAAPLPELWEHPGQQMIRCIGGMRCLMRTKRTPDEWIGVSSKTK